MYEEASFAFKALRGTGKNCVIDRTDCPPPDRVTRAQRRGDATPSAPPEPLPPTRHIGSIADRVCAIWPGTLRCVFRRL